MAYFPNIGGRPRGTGSRLTRFSDRAQAGRLLAEALGSYSKRPDVIVLGLPRGGVPVAAEVADAIGAPLDLMLVRKLGVPGHEELAMGAIATGGVRVLNSNVVEGLGIDDETLDRVTAREHRELERRERAYRGDRPPVELGGRTVILVDDGLATGATMRAAVAALRQHAPAEVVVAVPVAPPETCAVLRDEADDVICLLSPEPFLAIGVWYEDFGQVSDDQVRAALQTPAPQEL